jgi:hypothetical protein
MSVSRWVRVGGVIVVTLGIVLTASLFSAVIILRAAQLPKVGGDEPAVRPKLIMQTIFTTASLTDAQKAAINEIIESHQPAIQAARETQDFGAARQAMRETIHEVIDTLTPEQRETVKEAVRNALENRQP